MTDPYVDAWVDELIERRDAAFVIELELLPPLEDIAPLDHPDPR